MNAEVSLAIGKGTNYTTPVEVTLSVEYGDGPDTRLDIKMDAEQFAHFLSGTVLTVPASLTEYA